MRAYNVQTALRTGLSLVAVALAAGCAAAPQVPPELAGTQWTLARAEAGVLAQLAPSSGVTLQFESDRLAGYSGCNQYSGSYTLRGDVLTAGPIGATKRACAGDANTIERAWFDLLASPLLVQLGSGRLKLHTDGLVLEFDPGVKPR